MRFRTSVATNVQERKAGAIEEGDRVAVAHITSEHGLSLLRMLM